MTSNQDIPIIMSFNDNANQDVEIVADTSSDVTELSFGNDAENRSSSSSVFNKRIMMILIVAAAILLLCATGFSAAVVSRNNVDANFNSASKAPKASKAPTATRVPRASKAPKATNAPTGAPTEISDFPTFTATSDFPTAA